MIAAPLACDCIRVNSVMRQMTDGTAVSLLAQEVGVIAKDLVHTFYVIEYADFLADKLANPNRDCVGLRARAA
jgi:hypothetical protein